MTTNENTPGAHRPESIDGLMFRGPRHRSSSTTHAGASPEAGAIRADAWRHQAAATRSDVEAARTLRSLRGRGAQR